MPKKKTRGVIAGENHADSLIEFIHMMYNKNTSLRVLDALINRLCKRRREFEEN